MKSHVITLTFYIGKLKMIKGIHTKTVFTNQKEKDNQIITNIHSKVETLYG
jgi:hypothetical protein